MVELSIVIPFHNSAGSLEVLLDKTLEILEETGLQFELICVNDGSQDDTWTRLKEYAARHSESFRLVDLFSNYGQHMATICGLSLAEGSLVLTMDDDLQIPPSEIHKLLSEFKQNGPDIVYGIHYQREHSWYRNTGSRFLRWILKKTSRSKGVGSSFRLMTQDLARVVSASRMEFIFLDEIIAWHTNHVGYCEVEHHPRVHGKSGYSFGRLLSMTFGILFNYTLLPLQIMTFGGLLFGVLSFISGLYYLYNKVVFDVPLGYTSTIVAITFGTSMTLFCLGIIGMYLRKLYFLLIDRPSFHIREVIE